MAEKKQAKQDPEVQRRKKEEQARRGRRRTRQLFGIVLTVFIVVGAVSIVRSGVGLVRNLLDDTAERQAFQDRIETMVWFDVLPFSDVSTVDEETLRQVAIWGVYNEQRDALQTTEDGAKIVPVVEVDKFIKSLFGPDFSFSAHDTFDEPGTAMRYYYMQDLQAYILPITSMQAEYMPVVAELTRISGGGRRVTVGYASTRRDTGDIVQTIDYDHPVKYMDFIFYRDGSEYYLARLERNTTIEVTMPDDGTAEPDPGFGDSTSLVNEDDELLLPEGGGETSLPGEEAGGEEANGEEAAEENSEGQPDESEPEE